MCVCAWGELLCEEKTMPLLHEAVVGAHMSLWCIVLSLHFVLWRAGSLCDGSTTQHVCEDADAVFYGSAKNQICAFIGSIGVTLKPDMQIVISIICVTC